jgi:DNA-binding CsgD family transcriptional regulator
MRQRGDASFAGVVGREAELARLLHAFASHPRRSLLLTGAPGIGKTTLWEAAVDAARQQDLRVLVARPSGAEAQLAFEALVDLLDGVETAALAGLPPPQRHALDVALLRAEPETTPSDGVISLAFLNAVRSLEATGPLVIAIDDVHWLDRPSGDALAYPARRLRGEAVTFLLAGRPGRPSGLERVLAADLERVEVGGLSVGAIRHLLAERLELALPRHLLRRVVDATMGNPLFALEVGRSLAESGPPALGEELPVPDMVEELLGTRIGRLGAPTRRLLLALALSADLDRSQLEAIAGSAALEDALDNGLLRVEGGRVRAFHPLLPAAARTRSTSRVRRELHRELARVAVDAELRALHLALAAEDPDPELAAIVARAAAVASARGARWRAVELAEHALRLTPRSSSQRPDRLLELSENLMVAGEAQRAANLLADEIELLPPGPARARAHLLLAEGRAEPLGIEYRDHLERALAESVTDASLHAIAVARKTRFVAVGRVERIREAEAWSLEALPAARAAGPEVEREVLHGLALARVLRGRPIDDLQERFRALSEDTFEIYRSLDRVAAERHVHRGEIRRAREILAGLATTAAERGEDWSLAWLRLSLCELELRVGAWDTADELLDEWQEHSDVASIMEPMRARCHALLAAGRGHVEESERWAVEALTDTSSNQSRWHTFEVRRAQGIAALAAADAQRSVDCLLPLWTHLEREGVEDPGVFPIAPDLVEALVEVGAVAEARSVSDRLGELAGALEHPWGLVAGARSDALVRLASPTYDTEAAAALAGAAADYEELGLRFDRGRALLLLGRAQRRRKKWAAARDALERAVAAFEEVGSPGWVEEARAELDRVGARRPPPAGGLSPAERRVAELAAKGLANKEIARTLHVSVKTVEAHLSHAYRKLGVRSRAQLARVLGGN